MPYVIASILRANEVFADLDSFEPEALLRTVSKANTVLEGAEALGLFDVLEPQHGDALREFFTQLPDALDAAVLAAMRSALSRGVRTQISWQPGYEFELRAWEVATGSDGLLNIHIVSPHPPEG